MIEDIDPYGPFFISYRQSDARSIAVELSWLLRAAGVPVWHDATDLPRRDTESRLREALAAGTAGASLVVIEEIPRAPSYGPWNCPPCWIVNPTRSSC